MAQWHHMVRDTVQYYGLHIKGSHTKSAESNIGPNNCANTVCLAISCDAWGAGIIVFMNAVYGRITNALRVQGPLKCPDQIKRLLVYCQVTLVLSGETVGTRSGCLQSCTRTRAVSRRRMIASSSRLPYVRAPQPRRR